MTAPKYEAQLDAGGNCARIMLGDKLVGRAYMAESLAWFALINSLQLTDAIYPTVQAVAAAWPEITRVLEMKRIDARWPIVHRPNKYIGEYTLDLYCDRVNPEHVCYAFPDQFFGETVAQCVRKARKSGWIIRADRTATCPLCMVRPKIMREVGR